MPFRLGTSSFLGMIENGRAFVDIVFEQLLLLCLRVRTFDDFRSIILSKKKIKRDECRPSVRTFPLVFRRSKEISEKPWRKATEHLSFSNRHLNVRLRQIRTKKFQNHRHQTLVRNKGTQTRPFTREYGSCVQRSDDSS